MSGVASTSGAGDTKIEDIKFDTTATTDEVTSVCTPCPGQCECIPLNKLNEPSLEDKPLVVLISCGSFSPITNLHCRLFEDARNYLTVEHKELDIIGGLTSPVHDAYGKKSLRPQCHRVNMVDAALDDSTWIANSHWETHQNGWTRTYLVLKCYQNYLNKYASEKYGGRKITVRLLCGADLLESMLVPGLWAESDMEGILGGFGLAVMSRAGVDLEALIDDNAFIRKHKSRIHVFHSAVVNNISSTVIRKALLGGQSVKYLIPDGCLNYIYSEGLYQNEQRVRTCASNCGSCQCNTITPEKEKEEE